MRSFNSSNMAEDNYNTWQSDLAASEQQQRRQQAQLEQQQQQQQRQQQLNEELEAGRQPSSGRTTRIADEMSQDLQYLSREAPLDGGESNFGGAYSTLGQPQTQGTNQTTTTQHTYTSTITRTSSMGQEGGALENDYERADFRLDADDQLAPATSDDDYERHLRSSSQAIRQQSSEALEQLAPDNVDIQRPLQQAGEQAGAQLEPIVVVAASSLQAAPVHLDERQTSGQDAELDFRPATSSAPPLKPFLVSFMVDARGGAMRGCRHSGVRVIIPPGAAPQPMRITCRYLRRERLVHPPPLMEGEACASKIMEVGPAGASFLGPVLIEVPHFASLRGKEREIIILRSDSGEVWREHLVEADDQLIGDIINSAEHMETANAYQSDQENATRPSSALGGPDDVFSSGSFKTAALVSGGGGGDSKQQQQQSEQAKRLTRIVTNEFPQYFAIISRIRQEVHTVGPDGSQVDSQTVPRVQAIFTEGALTKRIKIGLQKKTSPSRSPQPQHSSDQDDDEKTPRAQSPSSLGTDGDDGGAATGRVRSPSSGRPSSAAAKRRSRFLACFGAGHGSHELLDQSGTDGEFASGSAESSSAGGDSPRQPTSKADERRRLVDELSDSEQDSGSLAVGSRDRERERKKRHSEAQLVVPENYYMEQESPLLLNMEPKTYGKRMASSSAQTDQKLQTGAFLSTSTRGNKSKRRGLVIGRRGRNKAQMTLPLHEPTHKQQAAGADTSLDSAAAAADDEHLKQGRPRSLISETGAIRDQDHETAHLKCLTRTIQTDSDSVTVQYVTIYGTSGAADAVNEATTKSAAKSGGQDDGYVSGSGDLKKDQQQQAAAAAAASKTKGLFSPFCVRSQADDIDDSSLEEAGQLKVNEAGQLDVAKKSRSKSKQKSKSKSKAASRDDKSATPTPEGQPMPEADEPHKTPDLVSGASSPTLTEGQQQPASLEPTSGGEEADESLVTSATSRSVSPTSKEIKLKRKQEKAEKAKRDKLERLKKKELDEANAKAEKARKKLEKEAKRRADKEQKALAKSDKAAVAAAAEEAADLGAARQQELEQQPADSPSPPVSSSEQPKSKKSAGFSIGATLTKTIQSVKFAPSPTKSDQQQQRESVAVASPVSSGELEAAVEGDKQVPLTKQVIDSTSSKSIVKAASRSDDESPLEPQSDRHLDGQPQPQPQPQQQDDSMVHVSIGESSLKEHQLARDVSFEDEQPRKLAANGGAGAGPEAPIKSRPLKPILKQQSSASSANEEQSADKAATKSLALMASELVSEATEEAMRAADELAKRAAAAATAADGPESPNTSSSSSAAADSKKERAKLAKAQKELAKRESKARLAEEKRLARELEQLAKQAEEAAKRAEKEAKHVTLQLQAEAEKQAQIAKAEAERAVKEVELGSTVAAATVVQLSSDQSDVELSSAELKKRGKSAEAAAKKLAKEAEAEAKRLAKEAEAEAKKKAKESKEEAKRLAKEAKEKLKSEKNRAAKGDAAAPPSAPPAELADSREVDRPASSSDDQLEASVAAQGEAAAQVEDSKLEVVEVGPESGENVAKSSEQAEVLASDETGQDSGTDSKSASSKAAKFGLVKFGKSKQDKSKKTKKEEKKEADAEEEKAAERQTESPIEEAKVDVEAKTVEKKKKKTKTTKTTKKEQKTTKTKKGHEHSGSSSSLESSSRATETASKSSFLGRLFKSRPKQQVQPAELAEAAAGESEAKPLDKLEGQATEELERHKRHTNTIVSEMYPSDPNNADGEMILEVNVPEEMIKPPAELAENAHLMPPSTLTTSSEPIDDQEATLVNMSQMADEDEGDDEATENVLSQATNDLPAQEILDEGRESREAESAKVEQPEQQVESVTLASELETGADEERRRSSGPEDAQKAKLMSEMELKSEKNRKELEAKLLKEAKKREAEEEKLRKKQEKEAKKLAEAEAKKAAKEEKERVKREARETKKLAELAKLEAKEAQKLAKKKKKKKRKGESSSKEAEVAKTAVVEGEEEADGERANPKDGATVTTTTAVLSSTTIGSEPRSHLEQSAANELDQGERVLMSSTGEVPINEETEVEQIVEEVRGEDGTVTKTTKTIETKYVTMRQEEVRVAERRDLPADEWERMQAAERQAEPSTSAGHTLKSRSSRSAESIAHAELVQICQTPSYFDPQSLPAEIKPETAPKKVEKKRVKLNQKLIKRAYKLARSEAKKAKVGQRRAEAEIAVCDEAARQARKELKRAVKEAKRAAKLAAKQHKKMDKVDKKLEKRAIKLEKRQKKIDKQLAKLAKKAAKKREKEAKKEAKKSGQRKSSSRSPSRSSKKSIRVEDISGPILRSSSRLSITRQHSLEPAPAGEQATGSGASPPIRQREGSSPSSDIQVDLTLDENEQQLAQHQQQQQQQELTQEQIEQLVRDGGEPIVHTITRTVTTEGDQGAQVVETSERVLVGREAEEASMRMELAAAREEDEEIDVVGDADEPAPPLPPQDAENQTPVSTPDVSLASSGSGKKNKKRSKSKNKKQKSTEEAEAQSVPSEVVLKLFGSLNAITFSPIVTIEPRRRKFHCPIKLKIPLPAGYRADTSANLRLLCSITGGQSGALWEDVTGSTPLSIHDKCLLFTTTVSARFWLVHCQRSQRCAEAARFAQELWRRLCQVPFMAKFVIFAKRRDINEANVRVFCMTDDKEDKTLEVQEHYTLVARSRELEVLEGQFLFLEFAGNLLPTHLSARARQPGANSHALIHEQLAFNFLAFQENRLAFAVRLRDLGQEPAGRIAFMEDSIKYLASLTTQQRAYLNERRRRAVCTLGVQLPAMCVHYDNILGTPKRNSYYANARIGDLTLADLAAELNTRAPPTPTQQRSAARSPGSELELDSLQDQSGGLSTSGYAFGQQQQQQQPRKSDWMELAPKLGIPRDEVEFIAEHCGQSDGGGGGGGGGMAPALLLLMHWYRLSSAEDRDQDLARGLLAIGRHDIAQKLNFAIEPKRISRSTMELLREIEAIPVRSTENLHAGGSELSGYSGAGYTRAASRGASLRRLDQNQADQHDTFEQERRRRAESETAPSSSRSEKVPAIEIAEFDTRKRSKRMESTAADLVEGGASGAGPRDLQTEVEQSGDEGAGQQLALIESMAESLLETALKEALEGHLRRRSSEQTAHDETRRSGLAAASSGADRSARTTYEREMITRETTLIESSPSKANKRQRKRRG